MKQYGDLQRLAGWQLCMQPGIQAALEVKTMNLVLLLGSGSALV